MIRTNFGLVFCCSFEAFSACTVNVFLFTHVIVFSLCPLGLCSVHNAGFHGSSWEKLGTLEQIQRSAVAARTIIVYK